MLYRCGGWWWCEREISYRRVFALPFCSLLPAQSHEALSFALAPNSGPPIWRTTLLPSNFRLHSGFPFLAEPKRCFKFTHYISLYVGENPRKATRSRCQREREEMRSQRVCAIRLQYTGSWRTFSVCANTTVIQNVCCLDYNREYQFSH